MRSPRIKLTVTAALLAFSAILLFPAQASAHAGASATFPTDAQQLELAPGEISVSLTENITLTDDALRLVDATGASVPLTPPSVTTEGNASKLSAKPEALLSDGWYAVVWRVVSQDGHPKSGSFTFQVGTTGESISGALPSDPTAPFRTAATPLNFLGYITTLLAIGLLVVSWPLAAIPSVAAKARRWAGFAAIGGLITAPLSLLNFSLLLNGGQTKGLGSVFLIALQSTSGTSQLIRTSALFALCTAVLLAAEKSLRVVAAIAAGIGAFALSVSYALTGHASVVPWKWVAGPALALHLLAGAAWIGGLPAVAWAFKRRHDFTGAQLATLISRFSKLATFTATTVAVAGLALAVSMLTKPADLFSRYGFSLLGKMTLVAAIGALGAYNHFVAVPRMRAANPIDSEPTADSAAARLAMGRTLRIEALAVVAVALATTILTSSGAPAAGGGHSVGGAHGHNDGAAVTEQLRNNYPVTAQAALGDGGVEVSVLPAIAGSKSVITVKVTDALGTARAASNIKLIFTHAATGIGPLEREMKLIDGVFTLETRDFGVDGDWSIDIVASTGGLSPEKATVTIFVAPGVEVSRTSTSWEN
jgi:copper transport protein